MRACRSLTAANYSFDNHVPTFRRTWHWLHILLIPLGSTLVIDILGQAPAVSQVDQVLSISSGGDSGGTEKLHRADAPPSAASNSPGINITLIRIARGSQVRSRHVAWKVHQYEMLCPDQPIVYWQNWCLLLLGGQSSSMHCCRVFHQKPFAVHE